MPRVFALVIVHALLFIFGFHNDAVGIDQTAGAQDCSDSQSSDARQDDPHVLACEPGQDNENASVRSIDPDEFPKYAGEPNGEGDNIAFTKTLIVDDEVLTQIRERLGSEEKVASFENSLPEMLKWAQKSELYGLRPWGQSYKDDSARVLSLCQNGQRAPVYIAKVNGVPRLPAGFDRGAFARRNIQQGTAVGLLVGKVSLFHKSGNYVDLNDHHMVVLPVPFLEDIERAPAPRTDFIVRISAQTYRNELSYVNHSLNYNLQLYPVLCRGVPTYVFVASRDIKADEQLLAYYDTTAMHARGVTPVDAQRGTPAGICLP